MTDAKTHGETALAAFDRALATEPALDAQDFTEATEHLCLMRKQFIRAAAQPDRDELLMQINAVISCSLSGHFPLGKVPWPLIRAARASLNDVLARVRAELPS